MEVREITSSDALNYYELRVQSENEYPEFVGFNAERELQAGPERIEELMSTYPSEGTVVFGAFNQKKLVGVAVISRRLSPKYRHKAFLWGMYVIREFRGSGAAKLLMQAAINWASANSEVIAITLQVTLSNSRGQQFYKRFGFNVFGTEQNSLFAAGQFHGVHYMELCTKNA
jgi:GNAT superfamily N-acetyltransferase